MRSRWRTLSRRVLLVVFLLSAAVPSAGSAAAQSPGSVPWGKLQVITASNADQLVRLATYGYRIPVVPGDPVSPDEKALAFSRDGLRLGVRTAADTFYIWELRTGRQIAHFSQPGFTVLEMLFNPDLTQVAILDTKNALYLWNIGNKYATSIPAPYLINIAFSRDGTLLAGCTYGNEAVAVLDTLTGKQVALLSGIESLYVSSIEFSPDGKRLLATSRKDRNDTERLSEKAQGLARRRNMSRTIAA